MYFITALTSLERSSNTLNWQLRGLLLQITGVITEQEIIKIAESIN
ncbi:DUF4367 domain-containing protein [Desulfosporosinus metallidurans]|nr:DUF4367 domain-containing protein [Desulfosporosinus metallidurans]